jgi:CRISPR-associated endonuclease Cas1
MHVHGIAQEQARDYGQSPLPLRRRGNVCVVQGYGVRVAVDRGQLAVSDGAGRHRIDRRYGRASHGLARVVILGSAGSVSLEALRWIADLGIGFVHLDRDGRALTQSAQLGVDDPRLRRAQALAAGSEIGITISRVLLERKLRGQLDVLDELAGIADTGDAPKAVTSMIAELERSETVEYLRAAEAQAAKAYWTAWAAVPLRFARRDTNRIPASWQSFGTRRSPFSNGPRLAATPGNALANYLYALAEQEAALALRAVGLDTGIGIVHADQRSRDSLALDLLEPIRPRVDRYLLDLLKTHTFTARDFYESRRGSVRILPPLTPQLAKTLPAWAELAAPLAEEVAETLVTGRPTPLTQRKRSAGREHVRRRQRSRTPATPALPRVCRSCGGPVVGTRSLCDECLPEERAAHTPRFQAAGPAALAQLRASGNDPRTTPEALAKVAKEISRRRREATQWNAENARPNPAEFTANILPQLQGIPLSALSAATGLSVPYCSCVRRGVYVPHPRHWDSLRTVADARDSKGRGES